MGVPGGEGTAGAGALLPAAGEAGGAGTLIQTLGRGYCYMGAGRAALIVVILAGYSAMISVLQVTLHRRVRMVALAADLTVGVIRTASGIFRDFRAGGGGCGVAAVSAVALMIVAAAMLVLQVMSSCGTAVTAKGAGLVMAGRTAAYIGQMASL